MPQGVGHVRRERRALAVLELLLHRVSEVHMTKWEHAAFVVDQHTMHDALNSWGQEGWELVSALPWGERVYLFFKRPSREV